MRETTMADNTTTRLYDPNEMQAYVMVSLETELTSLKTTLVQTRERFITDWTTEHYDQFKNRQAKLFRTNSQQDRDCITQHGESIDNFRKHISLNEKALEDKTTKLSLLKQELEQLTNDIDKAVNYNKTVSMEIQEAQQNIEQHKEALETTSTDLDQEQAELDTQASIYRESLDMEIRKTPGGRVQFIFNSMDRRNPENSCYFFTKLSEENRKYIDCKPPVPDLDNLVDKLNRTNDLGSFIKAMRRRFKQILG